MKLDEVLNKHKKWVESEGKEGERADLRKAIGASDGLHGEHGRSRVDNIPGRRKCEPAIMGGGEDDVISVGPDGIERSIRCDGSVEAFNGAVGSYERMVRPAGDRIQKLRAADTNGKELADVQLLDTTLRLPPS